MNNGIASNSLGYRALGVLRTTNCFLLSKELSDLFSATKDIKDGFIVDTLYGKYFEAIFDPPIVLVFTNEKLDKHITKLSRDRWLRLYINSNYTIEYRIENEDGTVSPIKLSNLNIKK